MKSILFAVDKLVGMQNALGAMRPKWYAPIYNHVRGILWALKNETDISQVCFQAAMALSRDYINPKIFNNSARKNDALCCRYDSQQRLVMFCIPLDSTESRFFKVVISHKFACAITFNEPAHCAFAPMAMKMCWDYGKADDLVTVDGLAMKWKHLAYIAQGQLFGWDDPPIYDACSDQYKPIWKPSTTEM